jgi:23S rRNA pseudouridine1911/1915/1917 synthase
MALRKTIFKIANKIISIVQKRVVKGFSFSWTTLYLSTMTYEILQFDVVPSDMRLDLLLSVLIPDISRAQIQDWIKKDLIKDSATGKTLKSSFKVKHAMNITVQRPVLAPFEPPKPEERAEALDIVYEDEYLLVINKPVGLSVHPGAGQRDGTMVNMLLGHTHGRLSDVGTQERPGIVHRLDKNTSGLLVVAKTNAVHVALAASLQDRTMKRIYNALVYNIPNPKEGTINSLIGRDPKNRQRMAVVTSNGKDATTHYTVLHTYGLDFALVECRLETGRTHQIRVHMSMIGSPVVGDPVYAGRHIRRKRRVTDETIEMINQLPGQALHARELIFPHPVTQEIMSFTAELPKHFQHLLTSLML